MRKKLTCTVCKKRNKCKELCSTMIEVLKNSKSNNDIYTDNTFSIKEKPISHKLDNILFTTGLSEIQRRDAERVIVALLNPAQKKVISLYCDGKTQKQIAKKLHISQSSVSQKIKGTKELIRESFIEIIPHII